MKKIGWSFLFAAVLFLNTAHAQNMVTEEDYLSGELSVVGLPDYPPFSFYTVVTKEARTNIFFHSVFLKPLYDISKKYSFEIKEPAINETSIGFQPLILGIRSGEYSLFLGIYSETKLFAGIEPIYPATVANPIHIITLPDMKEKIKTSKDLVKLKGAISKTEYLSDFVLRKIKPLNITYVESPYDAYEKLFTGEVDYLLGSMYYNRMMASRYGIEQYLSYSSKPLFKIPVFIGISKLAPRRSLYEKVLVKEISRPEFATAVKKEILRIVNEEVEKNIGIVPPAFTKKVVEETPVEVVEEKENNLGGQIFEKEVKQKSAEEILDGI